MNDRFLMQDALLNRVELWPRWVRLGVVFATSIGLFGVGFLGFIKTECLDYWGLMKDNNGLHQTIVRHRREMAADLFREQQIAQQEAAVKERQAQFPTIHSAQLDAFYKKVPELSFQVTSPKPDALHDGFVESPIEITASGSYQSMIDFLHRLNELHRFITWRDMSMIRMDSHVALEVNPLLQLTVTMSLFHSQQTQQIESTVETALMDSIKHVAIASNPFGDPLRGLKRTSLPLIELVGVLGDPSVAMMALLKDPSGQVYSVKTGDRIGREKGRIVRVNSQELVVEETLQFGLKSRKKRITTLHLS